MSGDRGPRDQPQLEDLVKRARTELRDWTDATDNDPGVAILELFALVGELLRSHSERLAAEAYLGTGRRGRSVGHWNKIKLEIDGTPWHRAKDLAGTDQSEERSRPTGGVYRATVLDNADPLGQDRLLVRVPDVSGDEAVWAAACLPSLSAREIPVSGKEVWIALESCDPSRPVWLGHRVTD